MLARATLRPGLILLAIVLAGTIERGFFAQSPVHLHLPSDASSPSASISKDPSVPSPLPLLGSTEVSVGKMLPLPQSGVLPIPAIASPGQTSPGGIAEPLELRLLPADVPTVGAPSSEQAIKDSKALVDQGARLSLPPSMNSTSTNFDGMNLPLVPDTAPTAQSLTGNAPSAGVEIPLPSSNSILRRSPITQLI